MPCGGIGPWTGLDLHEPCIHCGQHEPLPNHFVEEWDAFIHAECIVPYLLTEEGDIIRRHHHRVVIEF